MCFCHFFGVKLKRIIKKNKTPRFSIELLKTNGDIWKKYNVSVINKFEVLEESEDLNVYWEEIRNILQESMEEVVPIKENKRKKNWMSEKIKSLIGDRRRAKQSQSVERYKALDKQIKRECVSAKEKWLMINAMK